MMLAKKYIRITGIILIIIVPVLILNWGKLTKPAHQINVPTDKLMLVSYDSIKFQFNPFEKKIKFVAYMKIGALYHVKECERLIKKFPNIPFIFYVINSDQKTIKEYLQQNKIAYPVYYYPTNEWGDLSFISFIVDKNNKVIETTGPGMKIHFENSLKRIQNSNY